MLRLPTLPIWPARALGAASLGFAAQGAWAVPYELIYTGYLTPTEALNPAADPAPSYFDQNTAFTLNARFDDSSPNLAPPSPPAPPPFTPIVLRDPSGTAWNLTLDFYLMDPPAQALNTAQIIAVPEPASYAQLLAGLLLLGLAAQRRS